MATASKLKKFSEFLSKGISSAATLGKCLILSRKSFPKAQVPQSRPLIVMGNGPSLLDSLPSDREKLKDFDLLAVNFAPNSELFFDLKPTRLVLADPHFFHCTESDPKVALLWERIASVGWFLRLYLPSSKIAAARRLLAERGKSNTSVTLHPINLTPAEGYGWLRRHLYDSGLAMPRPRNVMIPAIMVALREGYRDIRLIGADHSWSRTLWVDEKNRVVSIQPHFYPDDEKERQRVSSEYAGYHLHDIYTSLAIAFRSYFDIATYASSLGAKITNATPGSFIDAFPRGPLIKI